MSLNDDRNDILIGLGFVLFGLFVYYVVSGYPGFAGAFPRLIVWAVFVPFGSLMVLRGALNLYRNRNVVKKAEDTEEKADDLAVYFDGRTIIMSAAIIISIFGIGYIGFFESMLVLGIVSCIIFRMSVTHSIIYIIFMAVALYSFLTAMNIRMPRGVFGTMIGL